MACWCINPTPEWIDLPGKNDAREAPGPADAYRLLYEDAQRSIASQEQKVDELRGRAGIESEPSASMAEIYRSLAWHYAEMRGRNDRKIRALQWLFIAASGLIGLQTIAWLLAPSGGG